MNFSKRCVAIPKERHDFCMVNRKTAGGLFLGLLLLLIFFSKTIYSYNLPAVTAVKPENGRLSKLEMSTGVVDFADVEDLYAAVGGTVGEVLVKEGDTVTEGQELLRLTFDRDEAERKLREIQNSRSKLHTDIQSINLKLEKLGRYVSDLNDETYEEEKASTYELDLISVEIRKAKAELADVRERHEDGEATDLELEKARYNLQSQYIKYDELEKKLAEQEEKDKESLEEKEKSRESKLKDYEADIAALKLDLQLKNIDISNLSIQEEPYKKALKDFDEYAVITALTGGTVVSLDISKGETIKENQLIASIGTSGEFNVDCSISLDNNFVIPGDVCELSNTSHVISGVVEKVKPASQGKTVSISFTSDEVATGETFDITFKKDSVTTYTLVPNGALKQDNDGYFLNQIKRRDGVLGKEFYLERIDIYIGDSDNRNTVITQGITFFEPIMLLSDKPAEAGDTISLENAGDFFES